MLSCQLRYLEENDDIIDDGDRSKTVTPVEGGELDSERETKPEALTDEFIKDVLLEALSTHGLVEDVTLVKASTKGSSFTVHMARNSEALRASEKLNGISLSLSKRTLAIVKATYQGPRCTRIRVTFGDEALQGIDAQLLTTVRRRFAYCGTIRKVESESLTSLTITFADTGSALRACEDFNERGGAIPHKPKVELILDEENADKKRHRVPSDALEELIVSSSPSSSLVQFVKDAASNEISGILEGVSKRSRDVAISEGSIVSPSATKAKPNNQQQPGKETKRSRDVSLGVASELEHLSVSLVQNSQNALEQLQSKRAVSMSNHKDASEFPTTPADHPIVLSATKRSRDVNTFTDSTDSAAPLSPTTTSEIPSHLESSSASNQQTLIEATVSSSAANEGRQLFVVHYKNVEVEALSTLFLSKPGCQTIDVKRTKRSHLRGMAFVTFETHELAKKAVEDLHGIEFPLGSEHRLKVMFAESMDESKRRNPKRGAAASAGGTPSPRRENGSSVDAQTGLSSPLPLNLESQERHDLDKEDAAVSGLEAERGSTSGENTNQRKKKPPRLATPSPSQRDEDADVSEDGQFKPKQIQTVSPPEPSVTNNSIIESVDVSLVHLGGKQVSLLPPTRSTEATSSFSSSTINSSLGKETASSLSSTSTATTLNSMDSGPSKNQKRRSASSERTSTGSVGSVNEQHYSQQHYQQARQPVTFSAFSHYHHQPPLPPHAYVAAYPSQQPPPPSHHTFHSQTPQPQLRYPTTHMLMHLPPELQLEQELAARTASTDALAETFGNVMGFTDMGAPWNMTTNGVPSAWTIQPHQPQNSPPQQDHASYLYNQQTLQSESVQLAQQRYNNHSAVRAYNQQGVFVTTQGHGASFPSNLPLNGSLPDASRLHVVFGRPLPEEDVHQAFDMAAPGLQYVSRYREKPYAFVKYATSASAMLAMVRLHGSMLCGQRLRVTLADPPPSSYDSSSRKRQRDVGGQKQNDSSLPDTNNVEVGADEEQQPGSILEGDAVVDEIIRSAQGRDAHPGTS